MNALDRTIDDPLGWLNGFIIDERGQLPVAAQQKQLPVEPADNMMGFGSCAPATYTCSPCGSFIPGTVLVQGYDLLQRREDIKDAIEIASGVAKVKEEIRRRREMASSWVELDRIEGIPMFYYQLDGDSVVHFKPFARIYNIQCTQYICALDENGIWRISWDTARRKKREIYVRDADLTEKKLKSLMIKRGVNVLAKQMKEQIWEAFLAWITEISTTVELHTYKKGAFFLDGEYHEYRDETTFEEMLGQCQ